MFSDSVHPKGMGEAIFYAVAGYAYLVFLGIMIIALAIVTYTSQG